MPAAMTMLNAALILIGAAIMFLALIKGVSLLPLIRERSENVASWRRLLAFMAVFLGGYVVAFALVIGGHLDVLAAVTATIFALGAVFVFLTVRVTVSMTRALSEALRARDDFVAIAGHELKTPLTALLMQIQVMKETRPQPPSIERIDKLVRSSSRLAKLIDQLLDVSRITAGRLRLEPVPCDLTELVRAVIDRFAEASALANCPVSLHGEQRLEGCWDQLRVDSVVSNLLSNAIKFGQGKPVDVEVATEQGSALLRVVDRGIGIDPEHRAKLFQRFERAVATRDYGGFGLGLWICRNIVDAAGGTLAVESEPGRGTTFTVRLPLQQKEVARAAP